MKRLEKLFQDLKNLDSYSKLSPEVFDIVQQMELELKETKGSSTKELLSRLDSITDQKEIWYLIHLVSELIYIDQREEPRGVYGFISASYPNLTWLEDEFKLRTLPNGVLVKVFHKLVTKTKPTRKSRVKVTAEESSQSEALSSLVNQEEEPIPFE